MKRLIRLLVVVGIAFSAMHVTPVRADPPGIDNYVPGPDSLQHGGVPRGKLFSFKINTSKIYPGTERDISVYIPAQYKADKPACVYVGFDGLGFDAPTVFDNLINRGELPVIIGVGISPGAVPSANGKDDPRFNRSFEFDALDDSLPRFVVDEVFPEVEKRMTPDGLPIKLSDDPNDRCTGGGSTGGIAAFTCAWERPDQFHRVFTAIGTFVCMRGGDRYPVIVRETDPKPIRIFQQDGSNDEWMGGPEVGDWYMGNVVLERALEFSGYEHSHIWGDGPHSGKQAVAIFPDAMRFLWRDWPKPVLAHPEKSGNQMLKWVIDPKAAWEQVSEAGDACDDLAVDPHGNIYFHDTAVKMTRQIGADNKVADATDVPADKVFGFASDGHSVTVDGFSAACLSTTSDGSIYATDSAAGKVWLIKADGSRKQLDEGLKQPTGIVLSPDGLWLAVMERATHVGYSYRVLADGSVDARQQFYWAHVPDSADDSGAGEAVMDRDGRLYVVTHMGVQVFDRNGRSRLIMPLPSGEPTSICFGGAKYDTLFVTSGGKLFKRHMNAVGAPSFIPPFKLSGWGAG